MDDLLVVTQNLGKIREMSSICAPLALRALPISILNKTVSWQEEGSTFRENALTKLNAVQGLWAGASLSDDSGLVVPKLGGEPGVYSSRYAGEGSSDKANFEKLLHEMRELKAGDRDAFFVTCLAYRAHLDAKVQFFYGCLTGRIACAPEGQGGFGYDPIFLVDGYQQTLAALPESEKNKISHRSRAMQKLKKFLIKNLLKK